MDGIMEPDEGYAPVASLDDSTIIFLFYSPRLSSFQPLPKWASFGWGLLLWCRVSSRRAHGRIFVRGSSPNGFRGSTAMGLERTGRAGPVVLIFVPFREEGHFVGYPL